jgi:hypothetical protein
VYVCEDVDNIVNRNLLTLQVSVNNVGKKMKNHEEEENTEVMRSLRCE